MTAPMPGSDARVDRFARRNRYLEQPHAVWLEAIELGGIGRRVN